MFGRFELSARLKDQTQRIKDAVEAHDADDLLARPVEDLVDELVGQFDLEPPVIHWDGAEQAESEETAVEVPAAFPSLGFDERRTVRVPAARVIITVPISGTTELLGARASRSVQKRWENSTIDDGELVLWEEWTRPTKESLSKWLERERSDVERQVQPIQSELESWRERLPETARSLVQNRRDRLLRNRGLEGALGLPVRRRGQGPSQVPVRRKKVATTRARNRARSKPFQPEPLLDHKTYLEVLDIVCSFGRALERTPRVAQKYDEEELRDQILVHLNGHFEGEAGGELFNGAGKTDILVRHDDRNVFIGECKFWEGQKRFKEAVDQLRGYMVWRDTKAAIILFVKQKDPSASVDKARSAIRVHPLFKRDGKPSPDSQSYSNFVLRHGDDDEREIYLALIPIIVRPT